MGRSHSMQRMDRFWIETWALESSGVELLLWVKFHRVERDIFYSGIGSTPDFLG
jgi:hypothetical protein